ncbi:MAG: hypothetical protein AAF495_13235 [Pseudomonadota bacterium]
MLSQEALTLIRELRRFIGESRVGVTLDCLQVIQVWGENCPDGLRPAMEELADSGLVRLDSTEGVPMPEVCAAYGLSEVAGLTVVRPLKDFEDRADLTA